MKRSNSNVLGWLLCIWMEKHKTVGYHWSIPALESKQIFCFLYHRLLPLHWQYWLTLRKLTIKMKKYQKWLEKCRSESNTINRVVVEKWLLSWKLDSKELKLKRRLRRVKICWIWFSVIRNHSKLAVCEQIILLSLFAKDFTWRSEFSVEHSNSKAGYGDGVGCRVLTVALKQMPNSHGALKPPGYTNISVADLEHINRTQYHPTLLTLTNNS